MKAVRIVFQRGQQEVRVTDDAEVEVLGHKDWTCLGFRSWEGHFYSYVQFNARLESWEEIYLGRSDGN